MNLTASIAGARTLWVTGGALGLSPVDRVKYALSWYLSKRNGFLGRLAPAHFIVQLPSGMRVPIRPNGVDRLTLADVFVNRLYDLQAADIRRVLDLGSNIGTATLFFAGTFPEAQFACVEPSPDNQVALRELIKLNHLQATVFEGAVGTDSGEAELHMGCGADMFSLTPVAPSAERLRVTLFSVPEIMAALGWNEIDLLKIDIEGYEKTLFSVNNDWLSQVRVIVGEAHGHVGYAIDDVQGDLAPFGFEVTQKSFNARDGLTIFEARKA